MRFLIDAAAGAATGVISGFGIGGGTLLVLYLTLFGGKSQLAAQGINLVYFIPCSVAALISHIKNKQVEKSIWIISGAFGTLAAAVAAYLATRLDVSVLSKVFGAFLVCVGVFEIISFFAVKELKREESEGIM